MAFRSIPSQGFGQRLAYGRRPRVAYNPSREEQGVHRSLEEAGPQRPDAGQTLRDSGSSNYGINEGVSRISCMVEAAGNTINTGPWRTTSS